MTHGSRLTYAALALLLLGGFLLRYRAVEFGFPLLVHPDEPQVAVPAAHIAATGDLDPNTFLYPSLLIYMNSAVFAGIFGIGRLAGIYQHFSDVPVTTLYLWGRLLTATVSVATLYVAFVMAARLAGSAAGLVAALLTSCSFLHFSNSFTITTDSPMAFWVMLSLLASTTIVLDGPRTSRYLAAGITAGLAGGTKYNAVFAVVAILIAHLLARFGDRAGLQDTRAGDVEEHADHAGEQAHGAGVRCADSETGADLASGRDVAGSGRRPRARHRQLLAALAAVGIAFVCSTPYALVKPSMFLGFLKLQRGAYGFSHPGAEGVALSYGFYLSALTAKFGLVPTLLALVGVVDLLRRGPRMRAAAVVLVSFALTYYGFMGAYRVRFDRNAVVLVPLAAVFAGVGLRALLGLAESLLLARSRRIAGQSALEARAAAKVSSNLVLGVLAAALLAWPVYRQTSMSLAYAQEVTLPDTRLLAKTWIEKHLPRGASVALEFYTPPLDSESFDVTELGYYGLIRTAGLDGFDYLVASSQDFGRFLYHPNAYPAEAQRYKEIFSRYRLIKRFDPEQGRSGGPSILVYQTH